MKQKAESIDSMRQKLKDMIKEAGSQNAFAKKIGMSRNGVQRWASGKLPEAESIFELCTKCEVSPNWLFGIGDYIPLSYAAQESIKDCGKHAINEENAERRYTGEQYTESDYEMLNGILNRILTNPYFYKAVRLMYTGLELRENRREQTMFASDPVKTMSVGNMVFSYDTLAEMAIKTAAGWFEKAAAEIVNGFDMDKIEEALLWQAQDSE